MTDPRVAIVVNALPQLGAVEAVQVLSALDAHMLSEEVVERVARELYQYLHDGDFSELDDLVKEAWRDTARAALRSLAGGK
jgi:hypothetical protein